MNLARRSIWRPALLSLRWDSNKASRVVSYVRNTAEELTGQSDVAVAQAQVKERRNELKTWRQSVADATARYEEVQRQLRHLYAMKTQLYQAQRRDLAALQTINSEEEKLLSEEQSLGEELESVKQIERESFEALGDSILNSHEKERSQSERMRYYSRLGSLIGAVLGFMGSNLFLRREVRRHQKLQENKMDDFEKTLKELAPLHTLGALDSLDHRLRQVVQEETSGQLNLLGDIRNDLVSMSADESEGSSDQFLVTGLGIFVLSYTVCVIALALSTNR